jgi:hypothetical protein
MVEEAIRYVHLAVASTAINRSGESKLHRVTINDPASGSALTISEGSTASGGETVGVLDCNNIGTYEYGVTLSGLTVSLEGTADVTVVYQ